MCKPFLFKRLKHETKGIMCQLIYNKTKENEQKYSKNTCFIGIKFVILRRIRENTYNKFSLG